jgi:hypothetical protein
MHGHKAKAGAMTDQWMHGLINLSEKKMDRKGIRLVLPGTGRCKTLCFGFCVPFPEAINTTSRIDQLLLAGVERMAQVADFNVRIFHGRSDLDHIAA